MMRNSLFCESLTDQCCSANILVDNCVRPHLSFSTSSGRLWRHHILNVVSRTRQAVAIVDHLLSIDPFVDVLAFCTPPRGESGGVLRYTATPALRSHEIRRYDPRFSKRRHEINILSSPICVDICPQRSRAR